VPVCPTIRDMRQQCSGVRTRQILFIRDHNVSLILQSAVRSHHSTICNYNSGNPHVIRFHVVVAHFLTSHLTLNSTTF
jgi:hypothetical protein